MRAICASGTRRARSRTTSTTAAVGAAPVLSGAIAGRRQPGVLAAFPVNQQFESRSFGTRRHDLLDEQADQVLLGPRCPWRDPPTARETPAPAPGASPDRAARAGRVRRPACATGAAPGRATRSRAAFHRCSKVTGDQPVLGLDGVVLPLRPLRLIPRLAEFEVERLRASPRSRPPRSPRRRAPSRWRRGSARAGPRARSRLPPGGRQTPGHSPSADEWRQVYRTTALGVGRPAGGAHSDRSGAVRRAGSGRIGRRP